MRQKGCSKSSKQNFWDALSLNKVDALKGMVFGMVLYGTILGFVSFTNLVDWSGSNMKVKDMLLKEAIEEKRAEDARAIETFGHEGASPV